MWRIYTILANGQALTPEVMKGVLKQKIRCCLVPITSKGDRTIRENIRTEKVVESRARNWNIAKRLCDTDILIGMDSDVVLIDKNAIATIIKELKKGEVDMVTLPTKEKHMIRQRAVVDGVLILPIGTDKPSIPHSVFAVWKDRFPELKPEKGKCAICEAIKKLKVKCLYDKKQIEQREL